MPIPIPRLCKVRKQASLTPDMCYRQFQIAFPPLPAVRYIMPGYTVVVVRR